MVLRALHHRSAEQLQRRELLMGVTLHVGLGQHIESQFVAEVIEHRIVGIVRGAHSVDVQSLHGLQVFLDLLRRDGTAVDRREVVAVHAVEHHALAIDNQGTIAADAHLLEAHLRTTDVQRLSTSILQGQHQVVEVRRLSTPQARSRHIHIERHLLLPFRRKGDRCCLAGDNSSAIQHLRLYGQRLPSLGGVGGGHRYLHISLGILVATVKIGGEEMVTYLCLGCSIEEAMAMDARQAPIVLTLQERTAREAIHLQGNHVLTLDEVFRNIELRGQIGVLAIAHALPVDPEIIAVAHAVEAHIDIAAIKHIGRNGERAAISTHRVGHVAVIHEPRGTVGHHTIGRFVEREGIGHIAIERLVPRFSVVQAPHLPA